MERFAFKIDKALKASLYTICRLCGIDNPEKVPIITSTELGVIHVDTEPLLCEKIRNCIGLTVSKDDKMPQTMCTLCLDKINDFYEFREMCFATNTQTRRLLGLKPEKNNIDSFVQPIVKIAEAATRKTAKKRKSDDVVAKIEIKEDVDDVTIIQTDTECTPTLRKKQKMQHLRNQDFLKQIEESLKPKDEIKDEPVETTVTNGAADLKLKKLKQLCNICDLRFATPLKLKKHKAIVHLPLIKRYVCTACDETIHKGNEIKNHQLWHKLSKTPYKCACCGDCLMSTYAYNRHLRDHNINFQSSLSVPDRECPLCNVIFATNFLYNTHPCAVRTKKCSGCDKDLRNELEFLRHSAVCRKSYFQYSKHIPVAANAGEACIQIKNENDVEAYAAEAMSLIPMVSLTRISDVTMNNVKSGKTSKKMNKKGNSKKELKRVDDLLKSTIDTLVSIKHEPEVYVETEMGVVTDLHQTTLEENIETQNASDESGDYNYFGDHHADEDDYDITSVAEAVYHTETPNFSNALALVKQEPQDCHSVQVDHNINIKKEKVDDDAIVKMPVLKIKIKKEHGTLNSSLVDDKEDDKSTRNEKKKKKKKRKDAVRSKESLSTTNHNVKESICKEQETTSALPLPGPIRIKQEVLDDGHTDTCDLLDAATSHAEATVMTSIPLMQLQIACVASGVTFNESTEDHAAQSCQPEDINKTTNAVEVTDVKPNRLELDRMLKITHVISGVEVENTTEKATGVQQENVLHSIVHSSVEKDITKTKTIVKHRPVNNNKSKQQTKTNRTVGTGKALKSTGGITRPENRNYQYNEMPQIIAVSSGVQLSTTSQPDSTQLSETPTLSNVFIKPEPCNRGYSDESLPCEQPIKDNAEQAYINSMDYYNVRVKQEKDIDICDMQLAPQSSTSATQWNGNKTIKRKFQADAKKNTKEDFQNKESSQKKSDFNEWDEVDNLEDGEDEYDDDDETDFEDQEECEEEEEREYREIEMPPLLMEKINNTIEPQHAVNRNEETSNEITKPKPTQESNIENMESTLHIPQHTPTMFVISNVCSQSTDLVESNDEDLNGPKFQKIQNEATNNLQKNAPITCDIDTTTISGAILEDKESLLEAVPFYEPQITTGVPTSVVTTETDNDIEEQQNWLNQEMATSSTHAILEGDVNTSNNCIPNVNIISMDMLNASEETDNLLNESADAALLHRQEQATQQVHICTTTQINQSAPMVVLDESNVNEIAENNNNANIERELQDDSVARRNESNNENGSQQ